MVASSLVEDEPVAAISQFIQRDQHVEFYKHVRRGLNGEVYFGKRIKLDDEVVYKFYSAQAGYDSTEEAVILKNIEHENILKIYDLKFLHPNYAYFVTPKISGEDLQCILDNRKFSTHEVLDIMAGILKGLTELHSKHKLVHRDLKLANILLSLINSHAIIADLGAIKKINDTYGYTSASKSTFLYLPPEAVAKDKYYFQSDIYQVGVMMFQLLGGHFPVNDPDQFLTARELKQNVLIRNATDRINNRNDIIGKKIIKGKLINTNTLPVYLDPVFKRIINWATNIKHEKRFTNTSLFLKEIHQLKRNCPDYVDDKDGLIIKHSNGKECKIYSDHKGEIVLEKKAGSSWRKDHKHNGTLESVLKIARKNSKMETPSFIEDHISQIPALQLLQNLGYTYLSTTEALALRGNKTSTVLLDGILREQLKTINSPRISSTRTTFFTDSNIENGIQAMKDMPMNEGYIAACETAYNLITLGKTFEQSVDGDKKSFTMQYIDWQHPENNVFHVTEEYSVMRSTTKDHYRPDIVLFVNGIPLCIIECKRPDIKDPITQAISQQLRSQQEEGIRNLYVYTQTLLAISCNEGKYATNGTRDKFWAHWEEKFSNPQDEEAYRNKLVKLSNTPLSPAQKDRMFGDRFKYVRYYFDALEKQDILPAVQDEYLLGLCSPERLLDFTYNFILFDDGEKKTARYQQFLAIKKAMKQITKIEEGKRKGGVIWHTQGSGKSLTMVMLAQAIALEKSILNPKIILVTDRTDLDEQITGTFRKCGMFVENASTGQRLVDLLQSDSKAVITTIINKFDTAVKKMPFVLESNNIFVLVDEGHRTQHGTFNTDMQKSMPNACFIAFTGTPLFKKDKSTLSKFGNLIDDYTVDKAVKDKAVVPLLYEGRHAFQQVNERPLDNFFNLVSEPLTGYQKADLKRKFSRADQLNIAEQKIYSICWDISQHFRDNFQGTGFKGQLVTQSKAAAIKYKNFLDEINIVSTELVISAPDEREGEDSAYGETNDRVKSFWKKMMDEHGNAKRYDKNIISRFKNQKDPEIIIVVDKLLTGFDVPQNTVLYLTRKLQGHTLLQAIARVNRIYPDKDYGYIIDYYGVLGALDEALELYSSFEEFDETDLENTLTNITEEIGKLSQKHSELWDIFKTISNKKDAEAYQQLLRDEAIRVVFYDKLASFARILKLALSSIQFHKDTKEKTIERYKEDLAFFMKLRLAVVQRYSDTIDYKQYEGQIQKLIDTHIHTDEVKTITELVNIFDKEKFQQEVEKTLGEAAKADKIASRTSKHISEKMEEDPIFYKKFSELLKDTIRAYDEHRISESQYLSKVKDIMQSVLSKTDSDIPDSIKDKDIVKAFYGITLEGLKGKLEEEKIITDVSAEIAIEADKIIQSLIKVDWNTPANINVQKKMVHLIGDYLIDEVRDKYHIAISFNEIDNIADQIVEVAKIRYK